MPDFLCRRCRKEKIELRFIEYGRGQKQRMESSEVVTAQEIQEKISLRYP